MVTQILTSHIPKKVLNLIDEYDVKIGLLALEEQTPDEWMSINFNMETSSDEQ